MQLFFITLILLIGAPFVILPAGIPFAARFRGMRLPATFGSVLIMIGGAGFFGAALSAVGGLNWLPESFEWPVGYVDGIVSMPDGTHAVPHTPSGRVQIYDADWEFVRGWHVDAGGGVFRLLPRVAGRLDVITARGNLVSTYTLDGELIARRDYSPATYSSFPDVGEARLVPTRPWLWTFSHPFLSLPVAVAGMGLLSLAERQAKRRAAPRQPAAGA